MAKKKKQKSWSESLKAAGYGNTSTLSENQRSLTKEGKAKAKSKSKSGEKVNSAYKNTNIKYNTSPSSASVTSTGRHNIESNKPVTSNITKPSIRYSNVTGRGESKYKIGDLNPFSRGYSINNNITNRNKVNDFFNINNPTSSYLDSKTQRKDFKKVVKLNTDGRSDKEKYEDAKDYEKAAKTDKDSKKYITKGKNTKDTGNGYLSSNPLEYLINKHEKQDIRGNTKTDVEKYSKYKFLNKDEINTYNYVLGKHGKEEAVRYLDSIDQQLEQRKADNETAQLKEVQENTDNSREYWGKLFKYRAGEDFKNAVEGLGLGAIESSGNDYTEATKAGQLNREETVNTIKDKVTDEKGRQIYTDHNGNESAIYTEKGKKYLKDKDGNNIAVVVTDKKGNMYAADLDKNGNIKTNKKGQYYTYELNEKLKGNLSSIAMETAETVIDQTPQLVLGAVTGSEIVSLGAMGASVFGNSKNQALKEGKTAEQATKFAILSALKEIGSEKVLGFVPGVNKENAGLFTKALEKTVKPLANNRVVSKFIGQALEEGAEEVVGDIFEPLIERASYGKNVDENGKEISLGESYKLKGKDVLKDMVIGTLSGAVMNTGSSVFSAVQRGNTTKAIQEMAKTSETESPKQLADELTFKETLENSKIQGRSKDITNGVGIIESTLGYENGKFAESYSKNELINMFGENNTNKYLNEVKEIRSEQTKGVKKALEGVKNYKEWRDEARNGVAERDESGNIIRKTRTVGSFTERNRLKTETENTNLNAEIAKEFELSEDKGVLDYEKAIREGKNESELPYRLSENGVNNAARRDIKDILKVDTSGYNVGILKQAVDNINYNETNAGTKDIARAKYIIDNYDSIERNKVLDNDKGTLGLTLNKVIGDNHYIVEMAVNTSEGNIFITDVLKTDIDRGTTIDEEGLKRQEIQDEFRQRIDQSGIINTLAEKVGLNVEYENTDSSENGYIKGDTVVLNVNSDKSFMFTFGHELTHYLKKKGVKSYESFKKTAEKIINKNTEYKEQKVKTESIYKKAIESGRIVLNENENTEDYIHEEVLADFVGNVVFSNDEKAMRAIVKEDMGTAQRIMEFFRSIHDTLKKVSKGEKGYKEAIQILKAEKAFNKAIGEIRGINALIGKNSKDTGNSIEQTADEGSEGKEKYSISTKFSLSDETDSEGSRLTNKQAEYFKDSKARDKDGNLQVLYHQTDSEFNVFDTKLRTHSKGDYLFPNGIFLKPTKDDVKIGNNTKQMQLYANITKNIFAKDRYDLERQIRGLNTQISERIDELKSFDEFKTIEYEKIDKQADEAYKEVYIKLISEDAKEKAEARAVLNKWSKKENDYLNAWNSEYNEKASKIRDLITEEFIKKGYDGIILNNDEGSFGRNVKTYFVLNSNQVKNTANLNPTENSDIRYSIQSDKEGNKYVKIDTDQNIFEGIAKKDYSKIAKMYMQDYLRGETALSKDDKAIIGRKGINKYTNPGKRQFLFDKKMRLTPELKNVLKIAKKIEESDASKANSKYKNWEYYNFKFSIDDKNFSGIINIGIDENGNKHFYEINNIKEARLGGISGISPESTVPKSSSSINSISKEAENSNGFEDKSSDKNKKYSFAGIKAKTANFNKLNEAKYLYENKEKMADIFKKTGWYIGKDNKWRFEIDNSKAKLINIVNNELWERLSGTPYERAEEILEYHKSLSQMTDMMLFPNKYSIEQIDRIKNTVNKYKSDSNIVEQERILAKEQSKRRKDFLEGKGTISLNSLIENEELFNAYPNLADVKLKLYNPSNNTMGFYNSNNNTIGLNSKWFDAFGIREIKKDDVLRTLLHEIQHVIQNYESFDPGANFEIEGKEKYTKNAGEIEARDVANRLNYTENEKSNTLPKNNIDIRYSINENFTKDVRDIIDKKSDKEYVKVYNGTPIPLMESGMENYPMYMTRNHIISTVLTKSEAKEKGFPLRRGKKKRKVNYHGLGEKGLIDSLSSLENPRNVYRYTDINNTHNDNDFIIDTGLMDKDGNNIIVTARITDNKVILNEGDYNLITSAYGKNNYDNYIQRQLADKKIRAVYPMEGNQYPFLNRDNSSSKAVYPRWSDIAGHNITEDNSSFNNSILENEDKVNKKHSISEETIREVENSDNEIMKEMLNEIRSLTKKVEELNKNSNIERTETENINQAIIKENNKKVNKRNEIPNIEDTVFDEVITTSKEKTQRVYNREVEKARELNKEAKKGLPTKEKREQIAKINQIESSDELIRYLEEQTKKDKAERESKKGENKKVPFNKFDKLRQQIFNSGHAFDKLSNIVGDNSVRDMYNSNLHSSQAAWGWLDKEQTDLWGNVTGKSVKDILEPIANEDKMYEFSDYLYHYLNIDRWKRGKALDEGVSENISSIIVQNYEENNPVFKETANEVWEYYRNILDYNVQAGLVEKEFAEELKKKSPHYIPLSIEKFSDEFEYYKPHEDFNEIENPIKLAKGGSGFTSLTLIDKAMIRSANNTIKNAKLNMLMNSVYDAVKANTDKTNDYVKIISEPVTEVEGRSGMLIGSVRIHANNIVTFGVNGFETKVKMQKDFIQGLNDLSSNQDYLADNVIAQALAKGVDYFKRLHTSYDPTFIIRNFFRDFQDALIWADKPLEFMKKYPRAFREAKRGLGIGLTRKARNRGSRLWDLYVSLGAVGEVGVNEYSDFIDSKGNIRKGINKIAGNIEKLNLLIEQAARFDEFLRQLEKDGQLEKIQNSESLSKNDYNSLMNALYKADDITLNFQRGGKITKTANKYLIPFINPALQDFSKFVRNITAMDSWDSKDKKQILSSSVRFCAKATLLGLETYAVSQLIGVIAEAFTGDDDEKKKKLEKEMSSYTDYFKKSHFLIPIWDEEKKEYITIRIPKGRILGSIVNFTSDTIKDGFNIENYKNDLVYLWEQISPMETTAIWGTLTQAKNNVNYFGSPIVYDTYSELPDKDQYDDSTTSIAKKIGEITNISPMKIDYVLDQYSGVLGDVIMPFLATDGNTSLYYNSLTENTLTDVIGNMTKRLKVDTVYSNNTNSKYSDMKQKLTEDSAVEKRIEGNYGKTPTKAMIALVKANDSEISKLYTKKEQIYKNTKLSNNEKREKCRKIQIKINKYKEATLEEVEAIRPELEKAYKENYKNTKKKYGDKAYGKVYSSDVANALVKKVKTEHAGKLALNMLYPTSDNLDDTDGSDKYNNGESIKNCKILKKAGVSYLEQAEYQVYVNKYKYKKKTEVSYEERAKKFKNKLKSLKNLNTSERNLLYMSTYKYNFNGNAKRYEVYGNVKYDVAMYLAKNKNLTTAQRAKIAKNAGYEIIKEGKDTYITW